MLIIAIPKSASTSLMVTLANLHHIPCRQIFARTLVGINIADLPRPAGYYMLFGHSDIREYTKLEIEYFSHQEKVYKQHIPPTPNNIKLLKRVKKVLLLRNPVNIIDSYWRSHTVLGEGVPGIRQCCENATLDEYRRVAREVGLLKDVEDFYRGWLQHSSNKNTCLVWYRQLINGNHKNTINRIEKFWGWPISNYKEMPLARERYTRWPGEESQ